MGRILFSNVGPGAKCWIARLIQIKVCHLGEMEATLLQVMSGGIRKRAVVMMVSSPWVRRDTGGSGLLIEKRQGSRSGQRGKTACGLRLDAVGFLSKCMHAWFEFGFLCS